MAIIDQRNILGLKPVKVSGGVKERITSLGVEFKIDMQVKENLCWAAATVSCIRFLKRNSGFGWGQCDLVGHSLSAKCTVAKCENGECDARGDMPEVLKGLPEEFGLVFTEIRKKSIKGPQKLGKIMQAIKKEKPVICEMLKHERVLYAFREDLEKSVLLADPKEPESASDRWAFQSFEDECARFFILEVKQDAD